MLRARQIFEDNIRSADPDPLFVATTISTVFLPEYLADFPEICYFPKQENNE